MFFWLANFVLALGQVTLAGAFASYYWALNKPDDLPAFPLFAAFGRALRWGPRWAGGRGELEWKRPGWTTDHSLGPKVSHRLSGLRLPHSGHRADHPSDTRVLGSAPERYGPQMVGSNSRGGGGGLRGSLGLVLVGGGAKVVGQRLVSAYAGERVGLRVLSDWFL